MHNVLFSWRGVNIYSNQICILVITHLAVLYVTTSKESNTGNNWDIFVPLTSLTICRGTCPYMMYQVIISPSPGRPSRTTLFYIHLVDQRQLPWRIKYSISRNMSLMQVWLVCPTCLKDHPYRDTRGLLWSRYFCDGWIFKACMLGEWINIQWINIQWASMIHVGLFIFLI